MYHRGASLSKVAPSEYRISFIDFVTKRCVGDRRANIGVGARFAENSKNDFATYSRETVVYYILTKRLRRKMHINGRVYRLAPSRVVLQRTVTHASITLTTGAQVYSFLRTFYPFKSGEHMAVG